MKYDEVDPTWLDVPCAECWAHTGEKCKPARMTVDSPKEHYNAGYVHRQRKSEAGNARMRPGGNRG
jgi:hypothetical protein